MSGHGPVPFRPVFVAGFARSGTTLLAVMLGRHSQLAATPETHFVSQFLRETKPRPAEHAAWCELFFRAPRLVDLGIGHEALLDRFRDYPPDPPHLFRAALEVFAASAGKARVVEKTPAHLPHLPRLLQWYPEARAICIVRDGRDAVRSLMTMPWSHTNLRRHCRMWRWCIERGLACARRFPGRVQHVRFEDLVQDPENTLRRIDAFLDVAFERGQIESHADSAAAPAWEGDWKAKATRGPDASRVTAWRGAISDEEKWLMNSMMGPYLARFGYPDAGMQGCPLVARARHALRNGAYRAVYHPSVKPYFAGPKRLLRRMGFNVAESNLTRTQAEARSRASQEEGRHEAP